MTNPRYEKGYRFEKKVLADLESCGYSGYRSYGSKSPADLYMRRDGKAVYVQCKTNGRFPPREWNTFIDFCADADALPILAMRGGKRGEIAYMRLTGKKDGSGKRQPFVPWDKEGEWNA